MKDAHVEGALVTLRWSSPTKGKAILWRMPWKGRPVESMQFHRQPCKEEILCLAPCLIPGGRYKMPGWDWRVGSLMSEVVDGE